MDRPDSDALEIADWRDSLDDLVARAGRGRAGEVLRTVLSRADELGVGLPPLLTTPYVNTIAREAEPPYPGDERIESRLDSIIRWNAMAMVLRANLRSPGIGGHLATYASAATFYEVGFNWFFRGPDSPGGGDQVFFQPHCAPAVYVRAFLEGRLTEAQLDRYRRETGGNGLPSYPHPRAMPDFWEFPNASMGLGPISALYQARFNRYLHNRGLLDTSAQRVWCFPGDGEMDEPEARANLHVAAAEGLDNLTFVVNCNLQRLDGPVRGNGKLIQELEALFRAAGWNVIKVIWASEWDDLLARDHDGLLVGQMEQTPDGEFQKHAVAGGAYIRERFFGVDPRLRALVGDLTDDDLAGLRRGGHDPHKIHAAYRAAVDHRGVPTVILAKTVKGWGLGAAIQGRNVTHQAKKLSEAELLAFRDRLELPIRDDHAREAAYYHPGSSSEEVAYLVERRQALGGSIPRRHVEPVALPAPTSAFDAEFAAGSATPTSTVLVFTRILRNLLRDPGLGRRIVPIIPDEARTFGMDPLFKEVGIYSPIGQRYEPVDSELLLSYREARDGQVLEEGMTEVGSVASFQAAATSYATHGFPVLPIYAFYSMYGFQRTGDQLWQVGDARGRGFLMGAIAGRTTLNGEGIQHQDGTSQVLASVVPGLRQYDPAYAYELAAIVRDGIERMYGLGEDVCYYVTTYNEAYPQPPKPDGVDEGIVRGLYLLRRGGGGRVDDSGGPSRRATSRGDRATRQRERAPRRVGLLASGPLLNEALRAAEILETQHGLCADVWSATSFGQLRREAEECEVSGDTPWVSVQLGQEPADVYLAVSDFTRLWPEQIRPWVPGRYVTRGPEGWGMCDTREALRELHGLTGPALATLAVATLAASGARPAGRRGRTSKPGV